MNRYEVFVSPPVLDGDKLTAQAVIIEADFYEVRPDFSLLFYIGADIIDEFGPDEHFGVAAPM